MKRTLKVPFLASLHQAYKVGAFALGAVALFGCPVYSNSSGASGEIMCDSEGNCCDLAGNCAVWNCDYSQQCPGSATCSPDGFCTGPSSDGGWGDGGWYDSGYYYEDGGTDATVDCSVTGCDPGNQCTLTNGVAQCLPIIGRRQSRREGARAGCDGRREDRRRADGHHRPARWSRR